MPEVVLVNSAAFRRSELLTLSHLMAPSRGKLVMLMMSKIASSRGSIREATLRDALRPH